jgi:ribosomal protein S21
MINCEVKLDKNKCTDKTYFDKKYRQFANLIRKHGIMDELRLRRCHMKPSVRRKLAPQISAAKWKFYN